MDGRATLQQLIEERGEDYASLSRLLGRNAAYVQQYIKRGSPKKLPETERRTLARYFGVSEQMLGAPPPEEHVGDRNLVAVPHLAIGASAGPGAIADDERPGAHFAFDPKWLRTVGAGDPQRLSIIRVDGDSMEPTLADGDEIMVDSGEGRDRLRDGIYVMRMDDALMVKRLALNPASRRVSVTSDNPAYPSWPDCPLKSIDIVGRVVWAGRRIV
jgi:phage repressor protein C with HTH and peptisase S24 domain